MTADTSTVITASSFTTSAGEPAGELLARVQAPAIEAQTSWARGEAHRARLAKDVHTPERLELAVRSHASHGEGRAVPAQESIPAISRQEELRTDGQARHPEL